MSLLRPFAPAAHRPRRPRQAEVARLYPRLRWSVLESTFLGYAFFYLVRNNLSPVAKEMEGALGYDHADGRRPPGRDRRSPTASASS